MFAVYNCITVQHDWRLVILAACICFLASLTGISLFDRAQAMRRGPGLIWIGAAGVATGCGIWATHFIAMLAYEPGLPVGYDLGLTMLSLVVAMGMTAVGLSVARLGDGPLAPPIGGAIVGAGVTAMHYTGMSALEVPGHITWDGTLVVASIFFGVALGTMALVVAVRRRSKVMGRLSAALVLAIAIVSMHFTGMGAVQIVPDPTRAIDTFAMSPASMAIAIAGAAVAILVAGLAGAFADLHLRRKEQELATAVNHMAQGLVMYGPNERMVVCNDRFIEMYGLSPEVVKPGCLLRDVIQERVNNGSLAGDPDDYRAEILRSMARGESVSWTVESEDGRTVYAVNRPIGNGYWVGTHDDITERKRQEALIAHMAHHDNLTDLPNRKAFNDHLRATLEEAARAGTRFAVLCIDLDRFKEVNDLFGHAVGDGLLRTASVCMQAAIGDAFLARLGGDEFTVICAEGEQPEAAEAICSHLFDALGQEFDIDGQMLRVGLSIGVAIYPSDGADSTTLLANADAALYRAKADGRGTVRFFQPNMDASLRERRALQHELRSAIERNQLYLDYQPQASIDGDVKGFEALIRWRHPTRGLISPDTFIPIAEESGLIIEIGEWVLREACREAATWVNPLGIAINLSPVQFRHGDLPRLVHTILLEVGLTPSRLELEVTEGVLIGDHARALSILRRLKGLGVKIAMDDFGTGYSSLSYLQSFPFDKLKIDQAFIGNLTNGGQSAAIIRAVIGLGRGLDLPVVAEGVETQDQLEFLVREACQGVQGYLIGHPGSIATYGDLIGRPAPAAANGPRGGDPIEISALGRS